MQNFLRDMTQFAIDNGIVYRTDQEYKAFCKWLDKNGMKDIREDNWPDGTFQ